MSRRDKLDKLFWKPARSDLTASMERRGNFYVDSGDSRFCPVCEKPITFHDGIAFCDSCGAKVVKAGQVADVI